MEQKFYPETIERLLDDATTKQLRLIYLFVVNLLGK